jgi:RNA polymerase sigma-70 factor (ECF subfamily)
LDQHRHWLQTVVRARLEDAHAVEDVLQEVAMAVLRQPQNLADPTKVAPWLYRIALRKVINHRRTLGRQRRLIANYTNRGVQEATGENESPGAWLFRKEQAQGVAQALQQLNASDRELLLLKYTEGWGYRDLAERLGISIKTVEYRLLRARDALRQQLESTEGKP